VAANLPGTLPAKPQPLTDVPPTHPYYFYVQIAFARKAITIFPDGTYRPSVAATRALAMRALVNAAEFAPVQTAKPTYNDVPPAHWAYSYVETAAAHKVVSAYPCGASDEPCPGTYFRPEQNITRGQLARTLYQAFAPE
jgi:hypothetical protein